MAQVAFPRTSEKHIALRSMQIFIGTFCVMPTVLSRASALVPIKILFRLQALNEPADAGVLQTDQLSCTLEKRCVYRQKVTGS